jgi:DNA-directed RNA polymerase specialized sigma24 family protein
MLRIIQTGIEEEKQRIFRKHFARLPERCKELLGLYLKGLKEEELRRALNYKTVKEVKNKKYQCRNRLKEWILQDPDHKDLYE